MAFFTFHPWLFKPFSLFDIFVLFDLLPWGHAINPVGKGILTGFELKTYGSATNFQDTPEGIFEITLVSPWQRGSLISMHYNNGRV